MYSELRQVSSAYPYIGDAMLESKKNFILSADERQKLDSNIKISIYKELNSKSLLTDSQLSFLIEKEKKICQ